MAPPKNETQLAKVDPKVVDELSALATHYGPASRAALDHIHGAFMIAEGIQRIKGLVRQALPLIMPLQGSALGFKTDKDKDGGYPDGVVVECATEALLRGLRLTGNEWNIIGGRCYTAQSGCASLVKSLPNLTDLELNPGVPVLMNGGSIVEYSASWKIDGKSFSLARKIPVRVNSGQGVDAILGKARRKMLAAIYERVTGSEIGEGEADDAPNVPKTQTLTSQMAAALAARNGGVENPRHVEAESADTYVPPEPQESNGELFGPVSSNLPD